MCKGFVLRLARRYKNQAAIGIEPMCKGFADPRLTTWLRRHKISAAGSLRILSDVVVRFALLAHHDPEPCRRIEVQTLALPLDYRAGRRLPPSNIG